MNVSHHGTELFEMIRRIRRRGFVGIDVVSLRKYATGCDRLCRFKGPCAAQALCLPEDCDEAVLHYT